MRDQALVSLEDRLKDMQDLIQIDIAKSDKLYLEIISLQDQLRLLGSGAQVIEIGMPTRPRKFPRGGSSIQVPVLCWDWGLSTLFVIFRTA